MDIFLFACRRVSGSERDPVVQWRFSTYTHALAAPLRNREPLSESDRFGERKEENRLGKESLSSHCAAFGLLQGDCSR